MLEWLNRIFTPAVTPQGMKMILSSYYNIVDVSFRSFGGEVWQLTIRLDDPGKEGIYYLHHPIAADLKPENIKKYKI